MLCIRAELWDSRTRKLNKQMPKPAFELNPESVIPIPEPLSPHIYCSEPLFKIVCGYTILLSMIAGRAFRWRTHAWNMYAWESPPCSIKCEKSLWYTPDDCNTESESYVTTDGQSASLSRYKAPIRGLRPDFYIRTEYGIRLTVTFLNPWGALSDERTGLSFVCAAGPCQRSLSRVLVPWDLRPYFAVSDLRHNIRPLTQSFHCCPLERVYQPVA
jgi:hypothetical protein